MYFMIFFKTINNLKISLRAKKNRAGLTLPTPALGYDCINKFNLKHLGKRLKNLLKHHFIIKINVAS